MLSLEDQKQLITLEKAAAYDDRLEKERVRARNYYEKHKERVKPRMRQNVAAKKIERDATVKLLREANATMINAVQAFTAALNALDPPRVRSPVEKLSAS
jgi:hypothetical protein